LLKLFSTDVQWKVIRVNHTLYKVEISGHELFELLGDEDSSHVELECGRLAIVVFKKVVWSFLWHI